MNFNSAAQPDDYWNTPEGQQAQEWYSANPGQGAAEYQAQNYRGEDAGPSYGMLSTKSGAGGGAGGPNPFEPGWQYPIDNPGAAVRNYFDQQGKAWNPFGQHINRMLDSFASGLLPQFLAQRIQQGGDSASLPMDFGNFIGGRATGSIAAPTLNQATQNMGILNAAQQQLIQVAQSSLIQLNRERAATGLPPLTLNTEAERQQVLAYAKSKGGVGMGALPMSIAGMMTDPESQMAMYLGSYLPALGPALGRGLGNAVRPQLDNYNRMLGPMMEWDGKSFMDYLTGSMNLSRGQ